MLADFGLSKWVHDGGLLQETSPVSAGSSVSTGLQGAGATPWMAPELLDESFGRPRVTRETDVYAMGMLIIEVLWSDIIFCHPCADQIHAGLHWFPSFLW